MWSPGQQLKQGKYAIAEILGMGGFGITYLAKEQPSGKLVTIKTLNRLRQQKANFDELQEKFVNEALRLAKCQHPNIVEVYKVFQQDGLWCMVMEYIDGESLDIYLDRCGLLPEDEALNIITQVGNALSCVHKQGLLHRDVKPQNIMVRKDTSTAVLIDFGLAREVDFAELISLTNATTPPFAPPEQFDKRGNFTPALDIYSLSATLYVLLAVDEPPYIPLPSPHLNAKIMEEMNIPLKSPQELNPKISQLVNDAIVRGMDFDPKKRPQSVQEWLELLKPAAKSVDDSLYFPEPSSEIDLLSERGIDYAPLRDLLAAGKWREADTQTTELMLKAAGRESEGWFTDESIEQFPCTDLKTIDRLWVKYSDGLFGFSVQLSIYLDTGNKPGEYDEEAWERFGDRVGWRKGGKWLRWKERTFTGRGKHSGHLPSGIVPISVKRKLWGVLWVYGGDSLLSRCGL